jgi:peptidoglycan/LPS O-acetylase OafA/YrhL
VPARSAEIPLDIVPSLDGWRGLTILGVVAFHCWYAAGFPSLGGGVVQSVVGQGFPLINYMFVISGFVMFLPTVRRGGVFGSTYAYGVRRVARIVPGFYLALVGVVVFWKVARPDILGTFWTWTNAETMLFHLVFLHWEFVGDVPNVNGFHGYVGFGIDGAVWTLSIEAIFYALLPLVAARYFRRPFLCLALAITGQTLWRYGSYRFGLFLFHHGWSILRAGTIVEHTNLQFPGNMASIAIGMTSAWLYVALARADSESPLGRLRRYAPLAAVGGLILLVTLIDRGGYQTSNPEQAAGTGPYYRYFGDLALAGAFALTILSIALSSGWLQALWANRLARWIGFVSYGVYLWHLIIIHTLLQTFRWQTNGQLHTFLKYLFVVIPGALVCGWLSYRFVEQPAIRLAKRHLTRRREAVDRVVIHEAPAHAGANVGVPGG